MMDHWSRFIDVYGEWTVLTFMWLLLWHISPKNWCWPSTWQQYSRMAVASISNVMYPTTLYNLYRNGFKNMAKSSRCCLSPQFPQISIWICNCGMCCTNQAGPWRPLFPAYRTGSNILVPETTAHLQGSSPWFNTSELFWQHNGDLHNTYDQPITLKPLSWITV